MKALVDEFRMLLVGLAEGDSFDSDLQLPPVSFSTSYQKQCQYYIGVIVIIGISVSIGYECDPSGQGALGRRQMEKTYCKFHTLTDMVLAIGQ